MTDMPVIHTERLSLRPYEVADFDAYAAMVADPVVTRFLGAQPMSPEDAWARLLRYVGHWSVLGYGPFAVMDRASGDFVGETGFMDFRREVSPKLESFPEAAWVFTSAAHGKGYAFEAASAAHRWIDAHHAPAATQCLVAPANSGSVRLADRLGYRLYDTPQYRGEANHRYVRAVAAQV